MRSSFAKSIYFGAAVLGLAGLSAVTTTTASAKSSAAKVTSSKALTTDATTRNVNFTGTNALYSKPGTVKGAKVVATTTTTKNLNKSTTSRENFRAYRVAKTNRGSIYYKVVSYNKVYRGWVYGGKSADTFAGGLTSYDTFKEGTLTADQKSGNYKLANPGKTEAGLTYKQPAWTQYKIGKTIADTTAYKDATFSVDKVGTRTREGDTWVHVVNQNTADTKADGWILLSNLTQTNALNEATQVKVVVKDTAGNTLKDFNYTAPSAKGKGSVVTSDIYNGNAFNELFQKQLDSELSGTGYKVSSDTVNLIANVKAGDTITLYAAKGEQAYQTIVAYKDNGTTTTPLISNTAAASAQGTDPSLVVKLPTLTTPFSGTKGANYKAADVVANLTTNKATTLYTANYGLDASGTPSTTATSKDYYTAYTLNRGVDGVFGTGNASAIYTAKQVKGVSPLTTTPADNGAITGTWGNNTTTNVK